MSEGALLALVGLVLCKCCVQVPIPVALSEVELAIEHYGNVKGVDVLVEDARPSLERPACNEAILDLIGADRNAERVVAVVNVERDGFHPRTATATACRSGLVTVGTEMGGGGTVTPDSLATCRPTGRADDAEKRARDIYLQVYRIILEAYDQKKNQGMSLKNQKVFLERTAREFEKLGVDVFGRAIADRVEPDHWDAALVGLEVGGPG